MHNFQCTITDTPEYQYYELSDTLAVAIHIAKQAGFKMYTSKVIIQRHVY